MCVLTTNGCCLVLCNKIVNNKESTSRRKRKKSTTTENYRSRYLVESIAEDQTGQELDDEKQKISKKRDRVEVVLERAHACLRKIKNFKASLLS